MMKAIILLLYCVYLASGQIDCDTANETLRMNETCYGAYLSFAVSAAGFSIDSENVINLVCNEGSCQSNIMNFNEACEVGLFIDYRGTGCSSLYARQQLYVVTVVCFCLYQ